MITLTTILIIISNFDSTTSKEQERSYTYLIEYLQNTSYVKEDRPHLNGPSENISVNFHILTLRNVDHNTFTYKLAIDFHITWTDPRVPNGTFKIIRDPYKVVWIPTFVVYNSIKSTPAEMIGGAPKKSIIIEPKGLFI